MFCKNCGKEIGADKKFCIHCGIQLKEAAIKKSKPNKALGYFNEHKPQVIVLALAVIFMLYFFLADKPFFFLIPEHGKISENIVSRSVVNILCEAVDSDASSGGSGTLITKDGVIITNSHIIPQDADNVGVIDKGCIVTIPDPATGELDKVYWGKPIVLKGLSDEYDLAYVKINAPYIDDNGKQYGDYPTDFTSILGSVNYDEICPPTDTNKLGSPVRIYGYPTTSGGMNLTITEGVLSSFTDEGLILTSAKVDSGNSGGLAVNSNGCMVGIPEAVENGKYQNLGVIIPMSLVLEFSNQVSKLFDSSN